MNRINNKLIIDLRQVNRIKAEELYNLLQNTHYPCTTFELLGLNFAFFFVFTFMFAKALLL